MFGETQNLTHLCAFIQKAHDAHQNLHMLHEYKLPSLGDGVTGKVTEILVKPGDKVTKEQIVLVVGTDKVDAEMPVDAEGTVAEILVKKGDDVTEGSLVLRLETTTGATAETPPPAAPAPTPTATPSSGGVYELRVPALGEGDPTATVLKVLVKAGDALTKDAVAFEVGTDKVEFEVAVETDGVVEGILVKPGDEVKQGSVLLRMATTGTAAIASQPAPAPTPTQPVAAPAAAPVPAPDPAPVSQGKGAVRISPLARKRAKELGIDLSAVRPADGASRLSYKDVLEYVKQKMATGSAAKSGGGGVAHKTLPNFEKFGSIERKPLSRIGVLTAENMTYAFNAIPHAWIMEKADITRLEQLRQQYKDQVKAAGGALTTTAIVAKAVCWILKKMPQFNASFDHDTNEVIYKNYYNIGIAVDTPRGLLVPVLRNCDQKNLTEISKDLTELSTRTRDGKNKAEDLDGGTFTISNIGGIGGTNMISIVNWPQVAILSITAAQMEARWNGTSFEPRLMMPLTIGWDHRVINGADAARFLVELKKLLEDPFAAWL